MIFYTSTLRKLLIFCIILSLSINSSTQPVEAQLFGWLRWIWTPKRVGVPPGKRSGGAVRGDCPKSAISLTALVPATREGLTFVEKTVSPYPNFWFYVPYTESFPSSSGRRLEFVLLDDSENIFYQATYYLPQKRSSVKTGGIISVPMPQIIEPLQEGRRYRWVFSVICNPSNRSGDATVNGWIEHVPINQALNNQLNGKLNLERIGGNYAAQGIWYETVGTLAKLLRDEKSPNSELQRNWISLLESVGLTKLSEESIVPLDECQVCRGIPAQNRYKPTQTTSTHHKL
ncbi:MAG: DUF928 domain-containing protein [Dolichospermum sp. DL01]|nr:MAG: DUF928 domain-containing protein [Dolichospermum sp. DL01]